MTKIGVCSPELGHTKWKYDTVDPPADANGALYARWNGMSEDESCQREHMKQLWPDQYVDYDRLGAKLEPGWWSDTCHQDKYWCVYSFPEDDSARPAHQKYLPAMWRFP